MESIEFHGVRQRTATLQCPQCCSSYMEGFQFCKCDSAILWIQKRLQELLASSYYVHINQSRGKKHGNKPWQLYHSKAKDTMRHKSTDGKYKSILERFQKTKDSEKVKLFITGMKRGVDISTTLWPWTQPIKHHMNNVNITTICGDFNVDRRTTSVCPVKAKSDFKQQRGP